MTWRTLQLIKLDYLHLFSSVFPVLLFFFFWPLLVEAMASVIGFRLAPFFKLKSPSRPQCRFRVHNSAGGDSAVLSSDIVVVNGASVVEKKDALIDGGNGRLKHEVEEKKKQKKKKIVKDNIPESLEPFWDDGYGTETVKDYFDAVEDMVKPDGGPLRWFSPVTCGCPIKDAPILLFLPGT